MSAVLRGLGPAAAQLVATLRQPTTVGAFNEAQWSQLVATARACNLLGPLAAQLEAARVVAPRAAARHLDGALQLSARQRLSVQWEAHTLQAALGGLGVPVVLLKGAAYVMAPAEQALGRGRLFGDIDVLVPRAALGEVESALMLEGWVSAKTDDYDQRYYRQWMHEIPPMQHIHRNTVIDVHHTILPLTSRNAPDPAQIIARATPLADLPALHVPAPEDLLVHSITHLVHEGELHNGLRDLHDIHSMLQRFGNEPGFWGRVLASGAGNDLAGPLLLGLRMVQAVFESAVPAEVLATLHAQAASRWRRPWLLAAYARALRPPNDEEAGAAEAASRLAIFVRSHALRMPLPLLLRHLSIKAWKGLMPQERPAADG
jgi:Uncharacterised nucleotidyltransferase